MISLGKVLTAAGRDALGRYWKDTVDGLIPWAGVFHDQLDTKGRIEVYKLLDGQEVELANEEREAYIARLASLQPRRFVSYEERLRRFNGDRLGTWPSNLNEGSRT